MHAAEDKNIQIMEELKGMLKHSFKFKDFIGTR